MYDVRSSQPYAVRDHNSGQPVQSIAFQEELDLVLSADTKLLKIWYRNGVSVEVFVVLCVSVYCKTILLYVSHL